MSKRCWKALSVIFLALGMLGLTLLTTRAAGGGYTEWSTDTFSDFCQGTMNGVDVWSDPGTARLDRNWYPNVRVNDVSSQSKLAPSLTFALTGTGGTTETVFLAVWVDERACDHCGDIYFARGTNHGRTWSPDVNLYDECDPDGPPYPAPYCPCPHDPDVAMRAADESLWAVWWEDWSDEDYEPTRDDGDIHYLTSSNWKGPLASITTYTGTVYAGSGKQLLPRIAAHAASGYLYTIWEDERADDGDIYISRYNPDVDSVWSTPVKVSDDTTGAEQRQPNLAVDADGNVYAVWEDLRENDNGEIYFSRWISGTWGTGTWSANSRLSDPTMDWANGPDIVTRPGGVLFAAWKERVPTGPATYDFQIVVARSGNGGDTWSRLVEHRLYDASASNAFYASPAIGVGPLGRVYVAWLHSPKSQASGNNVLFSLSPDGGMHWTQSRVLSWPAGTVDVDTVPALASDFEGQIVVAWQDFREGSSTQIYATGYPADHYLTSGKYARIFDGGPAAWGHITWTATITPGTGLVLATRVMTTAGAGWTEWFTHTASGEAIPHPAGRSIQYRAVFTSTGNDTPVLDEVVISYEQYRIFLPVVLRGN